MQNTIERQTPTTDTLRQKPKRNLLRATRMGVAVTAMAIGGVMGAAKAEASANITHVDRVFRVHSSYTPAGIDEQIHHIIKPFDFWKPSQKNWVLPIAYFLQASSAGFSTDCGMSPIARAGDRYSQSYYIITQSGTSQKPCSNLEGSNISSYKNEFQPKLNLIGQRIRESVGVSHSDETINVNGNREMAVADYICPPANSVTEVAGKKVPSDDFVREVILRTNQVFSKGSEATVSMCV